jgi:hypothetical protein
VRSDLADIGVSLGVGKVAFEDSSAEGVDLDLPEGSHPGSLEAEVEAPDAGKERADIHPPPSKMALAANLSAVSTTSRVAKSKLVR